MTNPAPTTVKKILAAAPPSQLDPSMVALVNQWDDPPTALQILEVLDHSIHGSLASTMVVFALQRTLEAALLRESTTLEAVVKQAVWRPVMDRG